MGYERRGSLGWTQDWDTGYLGSVPSSATASTSLRLRVLFCSKVIITQTLPHVQCFEIFA